MVPVLQADRVANEFVGLIGWERDDRAVGHSGNPCCKRCADVGGAGSVDGRRDGNRLGCGRRCERTSRRWVRWRRLWRRRNMPHHEHEHGAGHDVVMDNANVTRVMVLTLLMLKRSVRPATSAVVCPVNVVDVALVAELMVGLAEAVMASP